MRRSAQIPYDAERVVYEGPDPDYQGREICVNSNEDVVAIHEVTDRSNPVLINTTGYPTAATPTRAG